ncbi:hypothetical protein BKA93DRAFT_778347 [Sparassis latifolia]
MSSLKDIHPGFTPGAPFALVRQVPAYEDLPPVLKPTAFGPIPPIMHYGYVISFEQFFAIAATQLGFSKEVDGPAWSEDIAMHQVADHIASEVIHHPAKVAWVCVDRKRPFLLSLCTNWYPSQRLEEVDPKVREFLGIEEKGKWYLDVTQRKWRA